MAYVAIERFESVIRFSISRLQAVTACGCDCDSLFNVFIAANLRTGLGEDRKSWSTGHGQIIQT